MYNTYMSKIIERKKQHDFGWFECPRCGYQAKMKKTIKQHFSRKTPCPCSNPKGFELTDEIKEHIYKNRKWKPEKETPVKQIQNNYIQINNILNQMDIPEKTSRYIKYRNTHKIKETDPDTSVISYTNHVDKRLFDEGFDTDNLKMLMSSCNPSIGLTEHTLDDHVETIDKITKRVDVPHHHLVGVMYDAKTKKMYLYDEDMWQDLQEKTGIKKLIAHIRELYWNLYEEYLVQKMCSNCRARELLFEYYVFLHAFDLKRDCSCDASYGIWQRAEKETKSSVKNKLYKDIMAIVKNNTNSNIKLIEKDIAKYMKIDKEFEASFLLGDDE